MKQFLYLSFIVLLFGCGSNKELVFENKKRSQPIRKNEIERFFKENQDQVKELQKYKHEKKSEYNRLRKNIKEGIHYWINKLIKDNLPGIENALSPQISPAEDFLVYLSRDAERMHGKTTFNYKMKLNHLNSNSSEEFFETTSDQFIKERTRKYSMLAWSPVNNMLAFCAQENEVNNLFLLNVKYNRSLFITEWKIYKITNNDELEVVYFDPQWSNDGRFIAFTQIDANSKYSTYLYDLEKFEMKPILPDKETMLFRFDNKDTDDAFVLVKENSDYVGYFIEDFEKADHRKEKFNIWNHNQIYVSFGEYEERLAILEFCDKTMLEIYDYDEEEFIVQEEIKNINPVSSPEYFPLSDPIWTKGDNALFLNGENTIKSVFLNKDELDVKTLDNGSYINSLSLSQYNNLFFSCHENNDFLVHKMVTNADFVVDKKSEEKWFETEILEIDRENKKMKLKRKRRPIAKSLMESRNPDADITAVKGEVDGIINFKTINWNEVTLNKKYLIYWPENLRKNRKITVNVHTSGTSGEKKTIVE